MARTITANRRKAAHERAVSLNLTLPPQLRNDLDVIVTTGGYSGPAEYFKAWIRQHSGRVLPAPVGPAQ